MSSNICDIKKCKSVSLETGRFISELFSRSIAQPYPTIDDRDMEKLGQLLNLLDQYCSITDKDIKTVNKFYSEIKNIYPTARGSRQAPPLSDLMDTIYAANSTCK